MELNVAFEGLMSIQVNKLDWPYSLPSSNHVSGPSLLTH